jgi:hypothetical protein
MIVVQVSWVGRATDRAHAALLGEQLVELRDTDAVAAAQVVVAAAAVEAEFTFLTSRAVARLAVAVVSTGATSGPGEIIDWLKLVTVRAPFHTGRDGLSRLPLLRQATLAATRF